MKKLLFIALMPLLLINCLTTGYTWSPYSGNTTVINNTTGQELIDLQKALDSGVITQEEYGELKLKIIGRLDTPVDSTDTN